MTYLPWEKIIFARKIRNPNFFISVVLEGDFFLKDMHWLGPGFKIGLIAKLGKLKEL